MSATAKCLILVRYNDGQKRSDDTMRIKKLQITNYRGFESLTFEPPENLAVLIGTNGSGKSTVLDAIAIVLSRFTDSYSTSPFLIPPLKNKTDNRLLTQNDVRAGTENADSSWKYQENGSFSARPSCSLSIDVKIDSSSRLYHWSVVRGLSNAAKQVSLIGQEKITDLIVDSMTLDQPPLLIHYQNRRFLPSSPTESDRDENSSEEEFSQHRVAMYRDTFSNKGNRFRDFFKWFEDEENYENQIRLRENVDYRNSQLEVVRLAISRFLNREMGNQFHDLRIIRPTNKEVSVSNSPRLPESALAIDKGDKEFYISQLSDGEKTLLLLVVDIAKRLASLSNYQSKPESSLKGTGIILIDEIDLHLHPAWQRTVIPALRHTFPNCQFIVTTHSPQVLSNVPAENVFVLEDGKIWPADSPTFGRDTNAILSELMGVSERPIETKNKINACLKLIDEGNLEQAEDAVNELETMLGRFDTEVVRARTLIDFLSRKDAEAQAV